MRILSRVWYYLKSIGTLLRGVERPLHVIAMFLGWTKRLPTEIRLRHTGWRFKVRSAMDLWIIKETCLDRDYLEEVVRLEPDWRVVDIGAGLGDFAILAARQCVNGLVHAYEPLPESFALLQHNIQLNQVVNICAFPSPVSAQVGSFAPDRRDAAAVSTRFIQQTGEEATVATSLLQVLDALPGGRCDFMKIDCEGCEYDLLFDSPPALLARIDRISLEYHNHVTVHRGEALKTFLQQQGFVVKHRANPAHDYLGFLFAYRPVNAD